MKTIIKIIITSLVLCSCQDATPPKYLEAKIIEIACKPIAQISGTSIGELWKGYDNVVVINNPAADSLRIPADSVFYFKAYEITGPNECSNSTGFSPGINIRVLDFSITKP